uniref:Uncharacterized protein n=1 Tax=Panagrolaimus davidi TaxID=227884 RepID=A0A914PSS8_9BILA
MEFRSEILLFIITNKKNLIVCVSDVRQELLHIVKKFGDFSSVEHGEDIIFKLTINTDGVVPKGHGTNEIWPIYIQVADLPDHIKTLIESVAVQSVISDNGKPSEFAFEVALTSLIEWIHEQGEGEIKTMENNQFFERFLRHGKTYSTSNYNKINSNVIFEHNNSRKFGQILDIIKQGDTVEARIQVYDTTSIRSIFNDFEHVEIAEATELVEDIKEDVFSLVDDHIVMESSATVHSTVKTNIKNILVHCLELSFNEKKFFFDLAMKAECK